jgi:hypothetical protein
MQLHVRCGHCLHVSNARKETQVRGAEVTAWLVCAYCGTQWPYVEPPSSRYSRERSRSYNRLMRRLDVAARKKWIAEKA